jgi:hypothetical protein
MKSKSLLYASVLCMMAACNDSAETKTAETNIVSTTTETSAPEKQTAPAATAASTDDNAIATIDVNGVIVKLHQLIKFEPKGNQILKADNEKFNYYLTDISISNTTSETIDAGVDYGFNIDIESKDGRRFWKIDRSAKVISLYDMETGKKDQAAYDKFWNKINAGEKVRTILKGYEVPKDAEPYKFIYDNVGKGIKKEQLLNP